MIVRDVMPRRFLLALWLGVVLGALCALPACTVAPKPVAAQAASFGDNGERNSGFVAFFEGGALIDAGARDRYNALIKLYGREWSPAISRDHGIERRGDLYFISNGALQKFVVMSDWKRMGRTAK